MTALKVFGMVLSASRSDRERLGASTPEERHRASQVCAVVAARTQRDAAAALGVSPHVLRTWGGQTWNDRDVAAATARPGVVLIRALDDWHGEYVERPRA